jgi:hypothetical protein
MKSIEDARIRAYLEWVERNYPDDVVNFFRQEIERCKNPDEINLSWVLDRAIQGSPKTLELQRDIAHGLNVHCRS